jgi:hypothetical protein
MSQLFKYTNQCEAIIKDFSSYHQTNKMLHPKYKVIMVSNLDVLNAIIPPRDWVDNMDKLYIQYVSHQPASR